MSRSMLLPRAILLLSTLIFLGYIVTWILLPFKQWLGLWLFTLLIKTNTKAFGTQGTFMLIYTAPILLIAVLGCVYLQLIKSNSRKYSDSRSSGSNVGPIAKLRRPMLVRGPLGVVSPVELILFVSFIALVIWIFAYGNGMLPVVGNMNARQNTRHANDKMWQKKLRSTAFYFAIAGNFCSCFLFYPVTRGSSILPLLGLTSEGSIKYHTWIGHMAMFFFTMHSLMFVVYWAIVNDLKEMLIWDHNSNSNVPGEIAILFGLAMWATVHPRIRRKMYELFFYTHQLYIPFMFFYMLHTGFYFIFMLFPGFYLFLIDRFLRFLQARQKVQLVSARVLPCSETVELNFSKSLALDYSATSYVSIKVPSISSLQWHPFSISSNSRLEPDRISIVVKRDGSWTKKLIEKLAAASSSPVLDSLQVSMEGPYGPTTTDFLRYETLVLVAGGSGIVPMISIIRELIALNSKIMTSTHDDIDKAAAGTSPPTDPQLPRVVLICAFKHSVDLALLNLILPAAANNIGTTTSSDSHVDMTSTNNNNIIISRVLDIQIEAFVTRDKVPVPIITSSGTGSTSDTIIGADQNDGQHRVIMKTIWFKPDPSDEPFSTTLGSTYAWLWLAAIILSSFAMFLILSGLLGRFYVYPKDKGTNMVFSWTARAALNALFFCFSIMTTATIGVLLVKKKHAQQAISRVQSIELSNSGTTRTTSAPIFRSWLEENVVVDRDVESLPHESSIQRSTNVRYGERPNLQKILLQFEGSSTGVVVCGPAAMRHEVASICASGLVDDLHYESISYNS